MKKLVEGTVVFNSLYKELAEVFKANQDIA
jgi:hypothetical protein